MAFMDNDLAKYVCVFSLVVSLILVILVAFNKEHYRNRRAVIVTTGSGAGNLIGSAPADDAPWYMWILYAIAVIVFLFILYACMTSGGVCFL